MNARASALAVTAVLLAGCGQAASPGQVTLVTAGPRGHICLDLPPREPSSAAQPRVPRGAGEPAGFVECSDGTQRVPGDGEWSVRLERRADAGAPALATALRLPDEPAGDGACSAVGFLDPELYALDGAGHAALVRLPVDECGLPRHEVLAALDAIRWHTVATRRLRRVTPQAALDSGCETGWKEMAAIEGGANRSRGAGSVGSLGTDGAIRACTYRITDRSEVPTGTFESGRRIDGKALQTLRRALEAAPQAAPGCHTLGQRFTILMDARTETTYVELDGCRRVLTPDGGLRTVTPRLVEALTGG